MLELGLGIESADRQGANCGVVWGFGGFGFRVLRGLGVYVVSSIVCFL